MQPAEIQREINKIVSVLNDGGLILYPTDTIWGIGCDATNDVAVKRLFQLKNRPDSKAMISLIDSVETLKNYLSFFPEEAESQISGSDSPLTIIYDEPRNISDALLAADGSAAFRIPRSGFVSSLCKVFGKPIVSTSANLSGTPAPKSFDEIEKQVIEGVDYCCEYGRDLTGNTPSTILKIGNSGEIKIIRK